MIKDRFGMNLNPKNASVPAFVEKLWDILEGKEQPACLQWTQSGNSFVITNKEILCSSILPKYFKHSNLSSFVRQLNMYNFRKIRLSKHENEFCHTLFRKNQKALLIGIRRKPSEAQVEFGNQLITRLGLEKVPSNTESEQDIVKKETQQPSVIYESERQLDPPQLDADNENEMLRYHNSMLWAEYCRALQRINLIMDKAYKFVNATSFNPSFSVQNPSQAGLNCLMIHLASEEPAYASEQYEALVNGTPMAGMPMPQLVAPFANIILKKPSYS